MLQADLFSMAEVLLRRLESCKNIRMIGTKVFSCEVNHDGLISEDKQLSPKVPPVADSVPGRIRRNCRTIPRDGIGII